MSGAVQSVSDVSLKEATQDHGANFNKLKDDVFSSTQIEVNDLNQQFRLMQTMETQALGPVTDLLINHLHTSLPSSEPEISEETADEQKKIFNVNDSRCSFLDGVASFAAQTASNSIDSGVKESAMFGIFSNFRVPTIVVDSVPDNENATTESFANNQNTSGIISPRKSLTCLNWGGSMRRSKTYHRPYCIINRRIFTCRVHHRNRKYGVSQKSSTGVDELAKLLGAMATDDQKQTGRQAKPSQKWQYSPPPKLYTLKYTPPVMLTDIKEKSRSMNDLNLKSLSISSPGKTNQKTDERISSLDMFIPFPHSTSRTNRVGELTSSVGCSSTQCTTVPVEHVLTKFYDLNMDESL